MENPETTKQGASSGVFTDPPASALTPILARLRKTDPPRAKSLCVSLLGDAIAAHGNAIWLGDLIALLAPLGLNERLLRTSVVRLVTQHWLQSERHGRRSLYRLSAQGLQLTARASTRIYGAATQAWNGEWTLVALPRTDNGLVERTQLRRELLWEGFGMIAPGLFAHPQTQARVAHDILEKLGIPERALVLSARDLAQAGGLPITSLVQTCWNLSAVARQYRQFLRRFSTLETVLQAEPPTPADAFAARMLLLHNWRRIVLHDPQLPPELLPPDWPGHAARALCGKLYWTLFDASEAHLYAVAGQGQERYTDLAPDVWARFGGRPHAPPARP